MMEMAHPTQTSGAGELRPGHHWKEADRVREYVERNDEAAGGMAEAFGLLTAVLPFEREASLRVLDIGSGHGILAAVVLDAFPNARAVGLDISEAMMEEGRQRMARFGDRFRYHEGDFADGTLPTDLDDSFDLVVSSRAIHHISPDAKRRLFSDIHRRTASGGCFFDIDNMRPRDDFLRQRYGQAPDPTQIPRTQDRPAGQRTGGGREHHDPVDEQLAWLREAGFAHVDCFWKRLGRAMIGGFKGG
ncbi:MAG: methyltransferase domain-containing protein [Chloroflexi bacterium]|nr:methyltransferase domain-containing protein [Chloroflexota bacterium]